MTPLDTLILQGSKDGVNTLRYDTDEDMKHA